MQLLPKELVDAFVVARGVSDGHPPAPSQIALAALFQKAILARTSVACARSIENGVTPWSQRLGDTLRNWTSAQLTRVSTR